MVLFHSYFPPLSLTNLLEFRTDCDSFGLFHFVGFFKVLLLATVCFYLLEEESRIQISLLESPLSSCCFHSIGLSYRVA